MSSAREMVKLPRCLLGLVLTVLSLFGCVTSSPVTVEQRQLVATDTIADVRARIPRSGSFFDDAYGVAVFPSVTRVGFGFGGAYGSGIVVEGDRVVGTAGFWQFTSGIQAGARNFSMVVLFKDKKALDYYKAGRAQFLGQAGLAAATVGVAGTPAYNDGVAIFAVTRLALMGEFTVSGARFTYTPVTLDQADK